MKNFTITLDAETASWVRIYTARHSTSVSRLVREMLQQRMAAELHDYDQAMRRFLAKAPMRFKRIEKPYPKRDELHERRHGPR